MVELRFGVIVGVEGSNSIFKSGPSWEYDIEQPPVSSVWHPPGVGEDQPLKCYRRTQYLRYVQSSFGDCVFGSMHIHNLPESSSLSRGIRSPGSFSPCLCIMTEKISGRYMQNVDRARTSKEPSRSTHQQDTALELKCSRDPLRKHLFSSSLSCQTSRTPQSIYAASTSVMPHCSFLSTPLNISTPISPPLFGPNFYRCCKRNIH